MDKRFTNSNLEEFFRLSKNMPVNYSIEKVEKLINATPSGKVIKQSVLSSKLKFIIMSTSIVTIILVGLFSFFSLGRTESNLVKSTENIPPQQTTSRLQQHSISENTFAPAQAHQHLAPSDTIIDGETLLVNLSVEELVNLGFVFSDTGMYYKNYYQGEYSSFKSFLNEATEATWGLNEYGNKQLPVHSENNYYPVYITRNSYSIFCEPLRASEDFEMFNDTLVPVRVTEEQSKYNSDLIFWFIATPDLFRHLPSKYSWLEDKYNNIKEIKRERSEKNIVDYVPVPVINASRYIELSQQELEKLGFSINNEAVSYTFRIEDNIFIFSLNNGSHLEILDDETQTTLNKMDFNLNPDTTDGNHMECRVNNSGTTFSLIETDINYYKTNGLKTNLKNKDLGKLPFKLFYISDLYGDQPFSWNNNSDDKDKLKSSSFQNKIDYLVPVVIHKKDYSVLPADFIYWFEPSQALFDALPAHIGKAIEKEYKYITTPVEQRKEAPECEYFNVCHAPLYKDFRVFPNPVNALATINFTSESKTVGRIELLDINGKKLKTVTSHLNIQKGMNSCPIDLCEINSGIYILVLTTKKDYQTQRIIVER